MTGFEKSDHVFKVLLAGDSAVGKSCLLSRFTNQQYEDTQAPTIGVDYQTKFFTTKHERIKMAIWDTAGQERFRALTTGYYRDAHGVLLVYDVTRRKSYENLATTWLKEAEMNNNVKDAVKMIIGNKMDLENNREVSMEEAENFAKENGCHFIETSAKNDIFVSVAFEKLLGEIKETPSLMQSTHYDGKLRIGSQKVGKRSGMCC